MVFDSKNMISSLYFPYQPLGKSGEISTFSKMLEHNFRQEKKNFFLMIFLYVIATDEISLIPKFY